MQQSVGTPAVWRKGTLAISMLASVLVLGACEGDDEIPVFSSRRPADVVAVGPKATTLQIGGTKQLTFEVRDPNGNVVTKGVTWTSSDPGVVTVSSTGLVTAVGPGNGSVVAATAEGARSSASFSVLAPVAALQITGSNAPLSVGSSRQLSAVALDANGTPVSASFEWTSSNPAAAPVNNAGVVIGLGEGNATITATSQGKTATFNVQSAYLVNTLTLTPNPVVVAPGATAQITATPRDGIGNVVPGRTVTWSSRTVAPANARTGVQAVYGGSVSNTGLFTMPAGSFGSNEVTASVTDLGGTTTQRVLVNPLVSGQNVTGISADSYAAGGPVYAFLLNVPTGATGVNVTFTAQAGQDADLYVFNPAGTLVCFGELGTGATESCNVTTGVTSGLWRIEVAGWTNYANWTLRAVVTP